MKFLYSDKKSCKFIKGSITVFLSLTILALYSVSALCMEGGRLRSAKAQLYDASLSAGLSMLAGYYPELHDRFGLYAMDPNVSNEEIFALYLGINSDADTAANNASLLYRIDSIDYDELYDLANYLVLRRQVLEYTKYNVAIDAIVDYKELESILMGGSDGNAREAAGLGLDSILSEAIGLFDSTVQQSTQLMAMGEFIERLGEYEETVDNINLYLNGEDVLTDYIEDVYNAHESKYKSIYDLDSISTLKAAQISIKLNSTITSGTDNYLGNSSLSSFNELSEEVSKLKDTLDGLNADEFSDLISFKNKDYVMIWYLASTVGGVYKDILSSISGVEGIISDLKSEVGGYINSLTSKIDFIKKIAYKYTYKTLDTLCKTRASLNLTIDSLKAGLPYTQGIISSLETIVRTIEQIITVMEKIYSFLCLDISGQLNSCIDMLSKLLASSAITGKPSVTTGKEAANELYTSASAQYEKLSSLEDILLNIKISEIQKAIEDVEEQKKKADDGIVKKGGRHQIDYYNDIREKIENACSGSRSTFSNLISLLNDINHLKAVESDTAVKSSAGSSDGGVLGYINAIGDLLSKLSPIPDQYSEDMQVDISSVVSSGNLPYETGVGLSYSSDPEHSATQDDLNSAVSIMNEAKLLGLLDSSTYGSGNPTEESAEASKLVEICKRMDETQKAITELFVSSASLLVPFSYATMAEAVLEVSQVKNSQSNNSMLNNVLIISENIGYIIGNFKNIINDVMIVFASSAYENIMESSYATMVLPNRVFSCDGYNSPSDPEASDEFACFVGACQEYIIFGSSSEKVNQQYAFFSTLALRMIINAMQMLKTPEVSTTIKGCNVMGPFVAILWDYLESNIDMNLLIAEAEVPIIKEDMILSINGIKSFAEKALQANTESGLHTAKGVRQLTEDFCELDGKHTFIYTDYLWLYMCMTPNTTKLGRIANLVQLEMRYYQKSNGESVNFLMKEAYTYLRINTTAHFNPGMPLFLSDNSTLKDHTYKLEYKHYVGY